MIVGSIHEGSGLGNQLHRYVTTRVLALDLKTDFGFDGVDNFKGSSFMNLDWGKNPQWLEFQFEEQRVDNEQGVDIRPYDERIKLVKDHTRIDGEFQSEQYFQHRRAEIKDWLKVEPMEMPDNLCVINFRGGEYKGVSDLYLTHDYWNLAVSEMRAKGLDFVVCTDDPDEARKFFPDFEIMHEIGRDWRMIRYAKHLILSNSSFAILPAWLGEGDIIAPQFWARRNKGFWALPQNQYTGWRYV